MMSTILSGTILHSTIRQMNPIRRVARKLSQIVLFDLEETMLFELARGAPLPAPVAAAIHIQNLASDNVPDYCAAADATPQAVQERWAAGDRCYCVYLADKLAHFSWVKTKGLQPIVEAGITVNVEDSHFWIYHCWTAEWARGRKIYPAVLRAIIDEHFSTGYACAHIYTSRKNTPSQNGILRAGFRYIGSKWALRLGSRWFSLPIRQSTAHSIHSP